ncbi:unnamed protein product [Miscanthus lutarioriparius]|uniref:GATA-type domain-containing protein n=1 Tax=Miscanthus lutarioriparius TaxID=422564 RepID=A0A811QKZ1_9POAL|nr:unnamed protein product [Miscanthus lutarioriparius]
MEPPPPPPSCTVAGGAAGGGEDPFDDIVTPPDLLQGLGDDDGCLYGTAAMGAEAKDERRLAEAQAAGDGGRVDDGLSMTYRGHNKNMVHPIVVPQDFDRAAAISRYRKKRKITVKADYSVRREIASRIPRRGGKFAPSSKKSSENSVGETAEHLQSCTNCGERSEVMPKMRRGPNGAKNFCNACGLAWANTIDVTDSSGVCSFMTVKWKWK